MLLAAALGRADALRALARLGADSDAFVEVERDDAVAAALIIWECYEQPDQGLLEGVFVHNRAQGFWAARQRTRYGVGEPEFGAFYAETGAAPGAPDDLQHGGV